MSSGEELPFRPRLLGPGLVVAVLVFFAARLLPFTTPLQVWQGSVTAAVTVFVAWCWLSGALPLAPASLLPLGLLPLLGAQRTKDVTVGYSDPILWMFFGGFVLALAIERCGLHRRVALRTIALFGVRPRRLVLGFLMAATGISMWINNTAVSLMLLPIGWATVQRIEQEGLLAPGVARGLATAIMLAIAWGSSIGGVATPIGTAPNLIFFSTYQPMVSAGRAEPVSFLAWMLAFAPFSILLAILGWGVLVAAFRLPRGEASTGNEILAEVAALPRMNQAEWTVLGLFALTVFAWITRGEFRIGDGGSVPGTGWGRLPETWLGLPREKDDFVQDGSLAVLAAALAFVLPMQGWKGPRLMDWATARKMPLEILFLIGGGVAIANAFERTGLSAAIGEAMKPALATCPAWLAVVLTTALLTFLTEFTSNTAINSLMLPILASIAGAAGIDPRLLMLPCTVAASCGFALPVGTPPNTVVFSTGKVSMRDMVRTGIVLDLVSIAVLSAWMWFYVVPVLGIRVGSGGR